VLAGSRLTAYADSGKVPLQRSGSVPDFHTSFRFAALSYWLHDFESIHILGKEQHSYAFTNHTAIATGP